MALMTILDLEHAYASKQGYHKWLKRYAEMLSESHKRAIAVRRAKAGGR